VKYFKDKKLLFNWTDEILSLSDNKFIRKIGKSVLYCEDGKVNLKTVIKKTRPIVSNKKG
jgi:hypothetical protein